MKPTSTQQHQVALPATIAASAAEHAPCPIFQLDTTGCICYANRAAYAFLQSTPDGMLGTPFLATLDKGSQPKGQSLLSSAGEAASAPSELNQHSQGGEILTICYQALALPNGQGTLLFGEPQAKQIAATEKLVEQTQHMHSLMRIASRLGHNLHMDQQIHTTIHSLCAELQICGLAVVLYQGGALRLAAQHGLNPTPSDQMQWDVFFSHYPPPPHAVGTHSGPPEALHLPPDLLATAVDPHWKVATTRIQHNDDTIGYLLAFDNSYPPFRPGQIDLIHTVGSLIGPPIENAQLFGELRQKISQIHAIHLALDGVDMGMLITDIDGCVRYANATMGKLLGVEILGWIGQPRSHVMPALVRQTPLDQEAFTGELWRYPGPPELLLRRFHEVIIDQEGQAVGAVEVFSDVTQAQHIALMKDSFLSIAAHELKTPITAIKGYAQIALRMLEKQPESMLRTQMTMIDIISNELTRHMEDLLDVSRIQVGSLELDIVLTDLSDLINQVIKTTIMPSKRQPRIIETTFPPERPMVWWDAFRIERVLTNLLNNAIKYSPDGGTITIAVGMIGPPESQQVEITVTDFGIGIPAEERAAIFKRFYRTRQAVQHGFKGTGIGLFLCREIVEAHGGSIAAEAARHGGQGTTIAIQMPQDTRRTKVA